MSVLAQSEIEERLERGEIFVKGSWDPGQIRGASYELRVAPDYLIDSDGIRYWPNGGPGRTSFDGPIELDPGDVAFVSSVEKLCMPFDLVGNVAQKFRIAQKGLFVMGGLLVDPGYGMPREDGVPSADRDERLHFQIANIGSKPERLQVTQDAIAGLLFVPVVGSVKRKAPTSEKLVDRLFDSGRDEKLEPLDFFPETRLLPAKVEKLEVESKEQDIALKTASRSTELVVVFGVYLVAITVFTVALAALVEALADGSIDDVISSKDDVELSGTAFAISFVVIAGVLFAGWKMMVWTREVIGPAKDPENEDPSGS